MTSQVFLALGTNLGQRQQNLQNAVDALGEVVAIESISSVYATEPWGITNQPPFLNMAVSAVSVLDPFALLDACKAIEQKLGRKPGRRWGPRLIDIDLIFYDRLILDDERLSIPHPHLAERAFVLAPLADIASDFVDPRTGRAVADLLAEVDESSVEMMNAPQFKIRMPRTFAWGAKTYVMGILNITPDSFSGDGLFGGREWVNAALQQAMQFVADGADMLDVGGESTRPGSTPISTEQELERVLPVITAICEKLDVPISIDTYRAAVAEASLDAGADWVNDVWGLRMDPEMAPLIARAGCPVVIMHNRSRPKSVRQEERLGGRYVGMEYGDLIEDILSELSDSIDLALGSGVQESQIIIDPGIGFGKTVSQNIKLINELDRLKELGYPVLVGTSRKSFIGYTLDLPPEDRVEGTAATVAIAIERGADVIRVHDVQAMVRVARMTDRIVRQ